MASMNNQYFQSALRCHDPLHVTVENLSRTHLGTEPTGWQLVLQKLDAPQLCGYRGW